MIIRRRRVVRINLNPGQTATFRCGRRTIIVRCRRHRGM